MHDFVNEDALHERNQPRRFYKIIIPRFASLLNLDMPLSLSSKALAIDYFFAALMVKLLIYMIYV